jgi:hypothetical protein
VISLLDGSHAKLQAQINYRNDLASKIDDATDEFWCPWYSGNGHDADYFVNLDVMIYFDKPTQRELVHRFWEMLAPGGYLFVGHSESLVTSGKEFSYVQPAVYVK